MQLDECFPDVFAQLIDARSVTPVRVVHTGKCDAVVSTPCGTHEHMRGVQRMDEVGRHGGSLLAGSHLGDGIRIRDVYRLKRSQDLKRPKSMDWHVSILEREYLGDGFICGLTCFLAIFR